MHKACSSALAACPPLCSSPGYTDHEVYILALPAETHVDLRIQIQNLIHWCDGLCMQTADLRASDSCRGPLAATTTTDDATESDNGSCCKTSDASEL